MNIKCSEFGTDKEAIINLNDVLYFFIAETTADKYRVCVQTRQKSYIFCAEYNIDDAVSDIVTLTRIGSIKPTKKIYGCKFLSNRKENSFIAVNENTLISILPIENAFMVTLTNDTPFKSVIMNSLKFNSPETASITAALLSLQIMGMMGIDNDELYDKINIMSNGFFSAAQKGSNLMNRMMK